MKIEFELNVREEDKPKFINWFQLFAKAVLMAEDETFVNVKLDGKCFPDLYKYSID